MTSIQEKIWTNEQCILDVFHEVCVKNNLRYSLAYGTLLGAVRHKGFIPWDDDIDVLMPREDYEQLKLVWKRNAPSEYILQEPYTSPDLVVNFAKIRKNNTTFIQEEFEKARKYHKGIFIDIFPLDRVAKGRVPAKIQKMFCILSMLFNRGYTSDGSKIIIVCEKLLLSFVPRKDYRKVQKWAEKKATRWNNDDTRPLFGFQTIIDMKHQYNADVFDGLIKLEFEGKEYFAFKDYKQILKDEFGDYMQLPPEEERVWKHHPILVDFDRNYEALHK